MTRPRPICTVSASRISLHRALIATLILLAVALPVRAQSPEVPEGMILIDDMVLPTDAVYGDGSWQAVLWPLGFVPYAFDPNVTQANRDLARDAMAEWEAVANVKFVPWTIEPHHVRFENWINPPPNSGGYASFVGVSPLPIQNIFINSWNWPTLVHEIGHCLGMIHEHMRSDRDQKVLIHFNNIDPGPTGGNSLNFMRLDSSFNPTPYDFDSIMHYDQFAFSICPSGGPCPFPLKTITDKSLSHQNSMGQGSHMSNGDAQTMAAMYGPALPPQIVSLSTPSVPVGSAAFTLSIHGQRFHRGRQDASGVEGSRVLWNGTPIQFTHAAPGQIDIAVPQSLISTPGGASIVVENPIPSPMQTPTPFLAGGGPSNEAILTITPCTPATTVDFNQTPKTTISEACTGFHGSAGYQGGALVKSVAVGVSSSGADWNLYQGGPTSTQPGSACDFVVRSFASASDAFDGTFVQTLGSATATAQAAKASTTSQSWGTITDTFPSGSIIQIYRLHQSGAATPHAVSMTGGPGLGWELFLGLTPSSGWRTRGSSPYHGVGGGPVQQIPIGAGDHVLVVYRDGGPISGSAPFCMHFNCGDVITATLSSSATQVTGCTAFDFLPSPGHYAVAAIRPYPDFFFGICKAEIGIGAAESQSTGAAAYVVADGHAGPIPVPVGIASGHGWAEHTTAITCTLGQWPLQPFQPPTVVRAFEFHIPSVGNYSFTITGFSGTRHWALFGAGQASAGQWIGRNTAVYSGAVTAAPQTTTLNLSPGTHCVVISNDDCGGIDGTLNFRIDSFSNPTPSIAAISPSVLSTSSAGFTLTVDGSGFIPTSVVRWNGTDIPTTFVSPSQLSASVPAGAIASAGTSDVAVFNPLPGGGLTGPLTFTATAVPPALTAITPSSATAGSPAIALTVTGSSFLPTSIVKWDGLNFTTTYVGPTSLTATVPSIYLTTAMTVPVSVVTTGPNGGTSSSLTFTVNNPMPTASSVTPTSALAGTTVALTVNGSAFTTSSVVRFGGANVPTTFVSTSQLTATVAPSAALIAGNYDVTVTNPTPGGGTSTPVTFTLGRPVPVIQSLTPSSALAGSPNQTLTVGAANVDPSTVVRWNGVDLPTQQPAGGTLTAIVPSSSLATGTTASVGLFTPAPGGGSSSTLAFTVNNPSPTIASLAPPSAVAGTAGVTITVAGSGLNASSTVRWNGAALSTTYSSSGILTASVPANLLAAQTTAQVSVVNPTPGGGTSANTPFDVTAGLPVLASISPTSATAGAPQGNLTISGSGFAPTSVVRWNGSALATTFVTSTSLTAVLPAANLMIPGPALVAVFTPLPGGGISSALTFTVNHPIASVGVLTPAAANAGTGPLTLAITGTGFFAASVARWNGADLPTTYVSPTSLTATVSAQNLTTPGTVTLTVFNPAPGGGTSPGASFSVNHPVPTLASIAPTNVAAGSPATILTAVGTGLFATSVVRWNGVNLATTYMSPTQLAAVVPATNLASMGTANVTVFNPTPGGGTSLASVFTISSASPIITSLVPAAATAGAAATSLTVNGSGFTASSIVRWNGANLTTTFVSISTLTATIPAVNLSVPGPASVTVFDPAAGVSPSLGFTVNHPVPTISSLSPSTATAPAQPITLTVTGTGLYATSSVKWNGNVLVTTAIGVGSLTVTVPAVLVANPGIAQVTVVNPPPGGGTSAQQAFTVNHPTPTLVASTPAWVAAGSGQTTLWVSGSGFFSTSVVRWNGVDLATSYITPTALSATIPAANLTLPTVGQLTVFNPTPGGGLTAPLAFEARASAPTLATISPTSANSGASQLTLTATGSGFVGTSSVRWNGAALSTTFVNATTLTAVVPAATLTLAGSQSVTVFTPTPGGGTSGAKTFDLMAPMPTASSVSPSTVTAGSAPSTITVTGSGFVNTSVVRWNGGALATTYVNATTITAVVPAASLATPGTAQITILNPTPGGGTSSAVTLTIAYPVATLSSVAPTTVLAASPATTITLTGGGFFPATVVRWNGTDLATTFVSSTALTATIPAANLVNPGTAALTALNPTPGGGLSAPMSFDVSAPAPTLQTLSPAVRSAGSAAFTLTATGSGFVTTSIVRWNGVAMPTTFVNATTLTASIAAANTTTPGAVAVSIFNPTPGGGTSTPSTFTVSYPLPVPTSLSPASVLAGAPQTTLTVSGLGGFYPASVVRWNGVDLATTYVSATSLTAVLPAALLATPGSAIITVFNPAPGGGTNQGTFGVAVLYPAPTLASVSPSSVVAGAGQSIITATGTGFFDTSVVRWQGAAVPTTFVNATTLTATIPAASLTPQGSRLVSVFNPAPGGGQTAFVPVTVAAPAPTVASVNPALVVRYSSAWSLTVGGTGFLPNSTVLWNNSTSLPTTYVDGATLVATLDESVINAAAASSTVRVTTPGPGGGTSATLAVAVEFPTPVIESLTPDSAVVGSAAPTVMVAGTGLSPNASVRFDGVTVPSTFGANGVLTFVPPASALAGVGIHQVTVFNPSPGGGLSAPVTFTSANPSPVLTAITPGSAPVGSAATALGVSGAGFVPGSLVQWNGVALPTIYVSASALTATIPASHFVSSGPALVTIHTPAPGGGDSNTAGFVVTPSGPVVTALVPPSVVAGLSGFALSVLGSAFTAVSIVQWDGTPLPTTFVAGSPGTPASLTTTIAANLVDAPGTHVVTVFDSQGSQTSPPITFAVVRARIVAVTPTSIPIQTPASPAIALTIDAAGSSFSATSFVVADGTPLSTTFVDPSRLTCTLGPGVPATLRPGGIALSVQNGAATPLAVSSAWALTVGTATANRGTIRLTPLVPAPGETFGIALENCIDGLFSLYADAGNYPPLAPFPDATTNMVLSVGPLVGTGAPFIPLVEGFGFFGPPSGATLTNGGEFILPPIFTRPNPPIGLDVTLQGVFLDPTSPLGVRLTWARFPLSL